MCKSKNGVGLYSAFFNVLKFPFFVIICVGNTPRLQSSNRYKENTMPKRTYIINILKILSWVFHIALLILILFFMCVSHAVIYDDFYLQESVHIIDFSRMDAFKMIWAFWVISNITIAAIARFYNKVFSVIHFLLSQFSIIYFCWLLTL